MDKLATTQAPIDPLIAKRWSPRAFDASRPVSQEQVIALMEAARWAPSCFGDEPWRYIVCNRGDNAEAWEKLHSCLMERNQLWAKNAPLLILSTAMPNFRHNNKPNRWHQYDTGAANENICLQAAAMGMAAHQMGGYDGDKARTLFNIPAEISLLSVIAVGYQGKLKDLAETFHEDETAARQRLPLEQHCFNGEWANPLSV